MGKKNPLIFPNLYPGGSFWLLVHQAPQNLEQDPVHSGMLGLPLWCWSMVENPLPAAGCSVGGFTPLLPPSPRLGPLGTPGVLYPSWQWVLRKDASRSAEN